MKKFLISLAACTAIICGTFFTACADKTQYSVTLQTAEHGYVIVADTKVEAGEKVILAAHPNAGYKLKAYLLDGEVLDGCSFIMPKKDVTVSAQFEVVTYSITYVFEDGVTAGNNPDTYTVESATVLTPPERGEYESWGWFTYCRESEYYEDFKDFQVTSLEGLYGNLTLYAKNYNVPYEIHVNDSVGGECWVKDYYFEAFYGEEYNIAVEPDLGYELDYITVNGEVIEGTSFIMPKGDAEIDAYFKTIVYDITYELDGGENSEDNPDTYTVEDEYIYLSPATKEGFIFFGWCTDEDLTEFVYGNRISVYDCLESPLTLYAYFIPDEEE